MKLEWRAFATEVFLVISPEKDDSNYFNVLVWGARRMSDTGRSYEAKHWRVDQFSKKYISNSKKTQCPNRSVLRGFIKLFWSNTNELEL